jgi:dimethylhistidine N-methyltransferase
MFDAAVVDQDVAGIALAGLSAADKSLPPKLFYDAEGVRLFDAITRLPEYYLTRTERALLVRIAPRIAALVPPGACLVEYGASDEAKARLLFRAAGHRITAYVPIDVAGPALAAMARRLRRTARGLHVHPLCADFTRPLALPESVREARKLGFFPGSTIGNLEPAEAHQFLVGARATLGAGSWLVVGVDVRKDPSLLLPAYNDSARVTEAFNLNLLVRLNREAAASFDTAAVRTPRDLERRGKPHRNAPDQPRAPDRIRGRSADPVRGGRIDPHGEQLQARHRRVPGARHRSRLAPRPGLDRPRRPVFNPRFALLNFGRLGPPAQPGSRAEPLERDRLRFTRIYCADHALVIVLTSNFIVVLTQPLTVLL